MRPIRVPTLIGAVASIFTGRAAVSETLPARSIAFAVTVCAPSPVTVASAWRASVVTTGAASSTLVSMVIRPPLSSTPAARTRTAERYQPLPPALPLGVRVSVGLVTSPSVPSSGRTVTWAVTRPAA